MGSIKSLDDEFGRVVDCSLETSREEVELALEELGVLGSNLGHGGLSVLSCSFQGLLS